MSQSKKRNLGLSLAILALLGVLPGVPTGADDSAKVRVGLGFMGNPSHAAYPILRSRRMELGPPMVRTGQRPIGRANDGTMTYGREADEEGFELLVTVFWDQRHDDDGPFNEAARTRLLATCAGVAQYADVIQTGNEWPGFGLLDPEDELWQNVECAKAARRANPEIKVASPGMMTSTALTLALQFGHINSWRDFRGRVRTSSGLSEKTARTRDFYERLYAALDWDLYDLHIYHSPENILPARRAFREITGAPTSRILHSEFGVGPIPLKKQGDERVREPCRNNGPNLPFYDTSYPERFKTALDAIRKDGGGTVLLFGLIQDGTGRYFKKRKAVFACHGLIDEDRATIPGVWDVAVNSNR